MGNICQPAWERRVNEMDSNSYCNICREDKKGSALHLACPYCDDRARYCHDCWKNWIATCEVRRLPVVSCPNCRAALPKNRVETLMGRPYRPDNNHGGTTSQEVLDTNDEEVQRALLLYGYRRCPGCRMWIERVA
eukprot:scaffold9145_cov82-Amphora_coffeaeformis.AAC.1